MQRPGAFSLIELLIVVAIIVVLVTLTMVGVLGVYDSLFKAGLLEIDLKSPAFENQQRMPDDYTPYGRNLSPPIEWSDVPRHVVSYAITVHEGGRTHWMLWNLPGDYRGLPEGVPRTQRLEQFGGAWQGKNYKPSDNIGYTGPESSPGARSRYYYFNIYALDQMLNLQPDASLRQLDASMKGHILGQGWFWGAYALTER